MWEANQLMRDCACIQTAISSTRDYKKQLSSTVELSIYLWEYPLYLHHVICDVMIEAKKIKSKDNIRK